MMGNTTIINTLSRHILFTLIGILLGAANLFGQNSDCNRKLDEAKELFRRGKLEAVAPKIGDCLQGNRLNSEKKIEAYQLLTETYIFLNEDFLADSIYLELLKISPAHEVDSLAKAPDLVYHSKRFRTKPIVSLELLAGLNGTLPFVAQGFGSDNLNNPEEAYNSLVPGFGFGANAVFPVHEWAEITLGGQINFRSYSYVDSINTNTIQNNSFGSLSFRENHTWIDVPLSVRITPPPVGRIRPYAHFGVGLHFLLSADLKNLTRVSGDGFVTRESFRLNGTESPNLRVRQNFSLNAGIGMKYAVGINYLFVDLNYQHFTGNMVERSNRYTNTDLLYNLAYVDNDFRISSIGFQIGFAKSIYQPKLKPGKDINKPRPNRKSKTSKQESPKGNDFKDSPRNIVPENQTDTKPAPKSSEPKKESTKGKNPVVDILEKEADLMKRETELEIKNDLRRERSKILNDLRQARRKLREKAKKRIKAPLKDQ